MVMVLVVFQSMEPNLLMKTSLASITKEVFCPWLTLALTLTVLNSSLPSTRLNGKLIVFFLTNKRLNDHHVVFGELIEGENILRQLEIVGSRSGTPSAKIVIDECGEVKAETEAAKL